MGLLQRYISNFGVRGLVQRVLVKIAGTNSEFLATIPGTDRGVYIRLGTTDVAAFEHVFLGGEYDLNLDWQPQMIVDVGANVGMTAVYFSLKYPCATIFAIEPEPSNFTILMKNSKLFPNIIPIHAALWNHSNGVSIHKADGGHWGIQVCDRNSTDVPSLTIDQFIDDKNIQIIDILKIDAEGAECEIFAQSQRALRITKVVCAELHDRFRSGCTPAFESSTCDFQIKWKQGELSCAARH